MDCRIFTPINVKISIKIFESKEVPLKLRFTFLMRKFLTKSLARKLNPVIESLEMIKVTFTGRKARINLLRSFPIFKQYIFIYFYRNIIHCIPFLPYFFFDFDTAVLEIKPCMNMFPVNKNLSNAAINKIFLDKSSSYATNAKTFYTDGSKLNKDAPTGTSVYSPDFNLNIIHSLPVESSVFSAEAWTIYLAINIVQLRTSNVTKR